MRIEVIVSPPIDTNTYVIFDEASRKAIVVDPFDAEAIRGFIIGSKLTLEFILLTHEHYDHIAGVNQLKKNFNCRLLSSLKCSKNIQDAKMNLSSYFDALLAMRNLRQAPITVTLPYNCEAADITFETYYKFSWQNHIIELIETPGHSKGSICINIDGKWLFTGDSLLFDTEAVTRFPGGSLKDYRDKTYPFLLHMPSDLKVFPGHGQSFIMHQIKK